MLSRGDDDNYLYNNTDFRLYNTDFRHGAIASSFYETCATSFCDEQSYANKKALCVETCVQTAVDLSSQKETSRARCGEGLQVSLHERIHHRKIQKRRQCLVHAATEYRFSSGVHGQCQIPVAPLSALFLG
jgi:hypothetical protein